MKNTDFAVISCCGQREVSLYEVSGFLTISGTGCAIEGGSYGFTAARASGVLTVGIKFPNDLGKACCQNMPEEEKNRCARFHQIACGRIYIRRWCQKGCRCKYPILGSWMGSTKSTNMMVSILGARNQEQDSYSIGGLPISKLADTTNNVDILQGM